MKMTAAGDISFFTHKSVYLFILNINISNYAILLALEYCNSNEHSQSMFLSRNKKNHVYPCKPQFYYIKVGFKGVKIMPTGNLSSQRRKNLFPILKSKFFPFRIDYYSEVFDLQKNKKGIVNCVEVLRPSQANGIMSSASVYLTTLLLDRLCPLSSWLVLVHSQTNRKSQKLSPCKNGGQSIRFIYLCPLMSHSYQHRAELQHVWVRGPPTGTEYVLIIQSCMRIKDGDKNNYDELTSAISIIINII